MIEMKSVEKWYDAQCVYQDLSLSFNEGFITSILGPSGVGKTTLLRIIAGLETYQSGTITEIGRAHV